MQTESTSDVVALPPDNAFQVIQKLVAEGQAEYETNNPPIAQIIEDLSNAGNRRAAKRRAERDEKRTVPVPAEAKDFSDGDHLEIEVDQDEATAEPMTRGRRRSLTRRYMPRAQRMQVRRAKQDRLHGR